MRMVKPVRVLWALGLAAAVVLPLASVASASSQDVSIERSGSIIVFPKVVWDGTRDTIIQIANTSNNMVHARCFYVNGANPALCSETDFDIWLTRQQPTMWIASLGRSARTMVPVGATVPDGASTVLDGGLMVAYYGGFAPGLVPPVQKGFIGELKCVQVDASDAPYRGNSLKGEATIRSLSGDVSEYNALAFQGNPNLDVSEGDANDLVLDYTAGNDGEYSACPDTLQLNNFGAGLDDPVISQIGSCDGGCPISTELTLIPCSENLENQLPGVVKLHFSVWDEFELVQSTSITVRCFLNLTLDQISSVIFDPGSRGSEVMYSRITPVDSDGGVIGVAEEFRSATGRAGLNTAAAIFSLQTEGNRFDSATHPKDAFPTEALNCPTPGQAPCATDHLIIPQP